MADTTFKAAVIENDDQLMTNWIIRMDQCFKIKKEKKHMIMDESRCFNKNTGNSAQDQGLEVLWNMLYECKNRNFRLIKVCACLFIGYGSRSY